MIFRSTGSLFEPEITVEGNPEIEWIWDDGETSDSTTPSKDYSSIPGTKTSRLKVTPWSALTHINIGYDGEDGGHEFNGTTAADEVENQLVVSVDNMALVAPYLQFWSSSHNPISSLDFSNFVQLEVIESYFKHPLEPGTVFFSELTSVSLANTPALKRICFENCNLQGLDVSGSPALEDIRGATNNYSTVNFGDIGQNLWHICIRDNPTTTTRYMFSDMTQFPNIVELFTWNDNQAGALQVPSTAENRTIWLAVNDNYYTSADFTGALQDATMESNVLIQGNELESLVIDGCVQLTNLNASDNNLSSSTVDYVLETLDALGRDDSGINLAVDLRSNAPPTTAASDWIDSLRAKGWDVLVDEASP